MSTRTVSFVLEAGRWEPPQRERPPHTDAAEGKRMKVVTVACQTPDTFSTCLSLSRCCRVLLQFFLLFFPLPCFYLPLLKRRRVSAVSYPVGPVWLFGVRVSLPQVEALALSEVHMCVCVCVCLFRPHIIAAERKTPSPALTQQRGRTRTHKQTWGETEKGRLSRKRIQVHCAPHTSATTGKTECGSVKRAEPRTES